MSSVIQIQCFHCGYEAKEYITEEDGTPDFCPECEEMVYVHYPGSPEGDPD